MSTVSVFPVLTGIIIINAHEYDVFIDFVIVPCNILVSDAFKDGFSYNIFQFRPSGEAKMYVPKKDLVAPTFSTFRCRPQSGWYQ